MLIRSKRRSGRGLSAVRTGRVKDAGRAAYSVRERPRTQGWAILAASVVASIFFIPSAASAAAPPQLTAPTFSEVTETSAALQATVDPAGANLKKVHFDYIPLSDFKKEGFGSETKTTPLEKIPAEVRGKGDLSAATGEGALSAATGEGALVKDSTEVTGLTTTKGAFAVGQEISGAGIPGQTTITALGALTLTLSAAATEDQTKTSLQAASKTITGVNTSNGAFAAGQRLEPTKGLPNGASIESVGEGTLTIDRLPDEAVLAAALQAGSGLITNLTTTNEGAFAAGQTISGKGIPAGAKIREVEAGQLQLEFPAVAFEAGSGVELRATGAQPFSQAIAGLTPATPYRVRLSVENKDDQVFTSPEATLQTVIPASIFGPCANDPFRLGEYAPFGHPSALLPDCRAYEQATPVDKDGGDLALQSGSFVHAAAEGAGVTFGSTFGVPGGQGSQGFPFYAALRGAGEAGWTNQGLFPPASLGDKAAVRGWLPDLSASFAEATRLGSPRSHALFELHRDGTAPTEITPYIPLASQRGIYFYAGATKGGGEVVFESPAALPPAEGQPVIAEAKNEAQNVYAWDAASGLTSLASVLNTPEETKAVLPKGAFAGAYSWNVGNPNQGGPGNETYNYAQDRYTVSEDGSVFFTAAGTGQLYLRLNPTQPQSNPGPNGYVEDGHCTEPAKACTIHISASAREPADPGGSQPAALQFATPDGTKAFFTSSEELTDESNTGPVQEPAQIGRAKIGATEAEEPIPDFLPAHALGVAVDPKGEYIYWADPVHHSIGRANLKAPNPKATEEPEYIVPGETSFEFVPDKGAPELLHAPTAPRYVAVDDEHVYWTNTGPLHEPEPGRPVRAIDFAGTIGRAKIGESKAEDIRPNFITGASNPQGLTVGGGYLYWANNGQGPQAGGRDTLVLGRANSENGSEVDQEFFSQGGNSYSLTDVAVTSSNIYFVQAPPSDSNANGVSLLSRIPLTGGKAGETVNQESIAVDGEATEIVVTKSDVYWSSISGISVGRAGLSGFRLPGTGFGCGTHGPCTPDYLHTQAPPFGLATDDANLYFSTNGETPPNPGNDLYRYDSTDGATSLVDLTPDPNLGEKNGAEVQGVLGASPDGSYIYFVANGDLDGAGPAHPGDCKRQASNVTQVSGECNLYLWHGGQSELIARLQMHGDEGRIWSLSAGTANAPSLKSSFLSADGRTLLFSSSSQLTDYDNAGTPELYRYRVGEGIICASCNPTGISPRTDFGVQGFGYPGSIGPNASVAGLELHLLSADGNRAFFSTEEALVVGDTDSSTCHVVDSRLTPSCQDVYEWEASGSGTCTENGPAYSSLNEGCLYLLSTGQGENPAWLIDASPSGSDVYILTRDSLVGQDTDSITDIYDARAGGGLAAQNPIASPPCEAEGCKGLNATPPSFSAPPQFAGPGDPKPKRPKRPCKKAKGKKKGGCQKKHPHKKSKRR